MQAYTCTKKIDADHLAGVHLDESHYDVLVGGDEAADVFKPDGTPLVRYRPGWFPPEMCDAVMPACRKAAKPTQNRGTAAGDMDGGPDKYRRSTDGKVSNTKRIRPVNSGIIGYFDRSVRTPYCRQTSFLINSAAMWRKFLPYIVRADKGLRDFVPDRWAAQREYADKTAPDWVIPESTFTTVTVNRNFATATHKDAGDLKAGFGVLSCLRNDRYEGAHLCFPAYRVAVDLGHGCLCLADVHEWHGNTAFRNIKAGYERITLVFYYREKMVRCLPVAEEVEWAKNRRRGEPLK